MKDKLNKTARNLTIIIVVAITMTVLLFLLVYYVGNEMLDYYFETSEYIQTNETPYVQKLQQYINDNQISINECDRLEEWIKKQGITYFAVSKNGILLYGITYINGYSLAGNASEVLHNNWIYLQSVKFIDDDAEVFIYADYVKKYYKFLSAISAIIATITSILFVYFAFQREIARLHLDLLKARQVEDELRKSRNNLIQCMTHDLRTPLTGLMAYIEIVKLEVAAGTCNMIHVDKIWDKAIEIKNLTDRIFDYAGMNNVITKETALEPESFRNIFEDYLSDFCTVMKTKGFEINSDEVIWPAGNVAVNFELLGRIFNNLESNIDKYAKTKSEIILKVQSENNFIHIIIQNRVGIQQRTSGSIGIGLKNIDMMMKTMNGKFCHKHLGQTYTIWLSFPITST